MYTEDKIILGSEGNELVLSPNLHSWDNDLVEVYNDSHVLYLEVFSTNTFTGVELDLNDMKLLRDYLTDKIELLEK